MDSTLERIDETLDLNSLISPLLRRWKLLLVVTLLGAAVTFAASRHQPRTYQSTATIYIPQKQMGSDILRSIPVAIGGGGSSTGYYAALLQSNTVFSRVISRLDLRHRRAFTQGKAVSSQEALDRVRRLVDIKENKNGTISIVARAYDPKLAADMSNLLLDTMSSMVVDTSKRKVDFISDKLDETNRDLRKAEDEMLGFLETNDVAAVEEQTKGTIDQIIALDANLLSMDVELESLRSRLANAGDLETLADDEVRRKSLESSRSLVAAKREILQQKVAALPALATRYARLQRKIGVLSKTFEILTQQYQLERITQQGEDGDYQIIDRARPNPKKIAPRTTLNTVVGGMTSFLLAALLVSSRFSVSKPRKVR